jgi:hypothetical protein
MDGLRNDMGRFVRKLFHIPENTVVQQWQYEAGAKVKPIIDSLEQRNIELMQANSVLKEESILRTDNFEVEMNTMRSRAKSCIVYSKTAMMLAYNRDVDLETAVSNIDEMCEEFLL